MLKSTHDKIPTSHTQLVNNSHKYPQITRHWWHSHSTACLVCEWQQCIYTRSSTSYNYTKLHTVNDSATR